MNLTENVFGGVGNKPNLLRTKTYKGKCIDSVIFKVFI